MLCLLVASLLGAAGQFFYKSGAARAIGGPLTYVLNLRLLGGVACYIGVMLLFITAFKRGGQLSVLYPIYATSCIFSAIGAAWLYGEQIRPMNIAGMGFLVTGMFLMGWET